MAAEIAQKAPPDGYTLLLEGGSFWVAPLLRPMPYDPVRDFSPVSTVTTSPNLLVVHAAVPVNSVKELIGLAKAKPGTLNYASGGLGGSSHLAAELLKSTAGVNIVRVDYKGTGTAFSALLSGETQIMLIPVAGIGSNMKSEKLKVLAVTSTQRSTTFPNLPTMSEAGVPGFASIVLQGMFVPTKTPMPVINRLNQEIVRILNRPDVKEKFTRTGQDAFGSTPQEFAVLIQSEIAKWGKVIKEAGIKAE
jgi:tripartite-type tricarboxylate transporter receptor subunit TctC